LEEVIRVYQAIGTVSISGDEAGRSLMFDQLSKLIKLLSEINPSDPVSKALIEEIYLAPLQVNRAK